MSISSVPSSPDASASSLEHDFLAALREGELRLGPLVERLHADGASAPAMALVEALHIYQEELSQQVIEAREGRMRAEVAQARFQRLFEQLPVPALVVDAQGHLLQVNAAAAALHVDPGLIGEARLATLFGKVWLDVLAEALERAARGESLVLSRLLLHLPRLGSAVGTALGPRRIVDIHINRLPGPPLAAGMPPAAAAGMSFVVILIDRTEEVEQQRRIELQHQRLEQSEGRLHDVAISVPGVLFQWGVPTTGQPRLIYISERVETEFGVEAALVMADWRQFPLAESDLDALLHSLHAAAGAYRDWQFEFSPVNQPGRVWLALGRPAHHADNEVRISGMLLDVTESRAAQRALAESEALYRSLIEHNQNEVAQLDASFRVRFANRAFLHAAGWPSGSMLGMHYGELLAPGDWQHVERELRRLTPEQPHYFHEHHSNPQLFGDRVYLSTISALFTAATPEHPPVLRGYLAVCTDVTELARARHEQAEQLELVRARAEAGRLLMAGEPTAALAALLGPVRKLSGSTWVAVDELRRPLGECGAAAWLLCAVDAADGATAGATWRAVAADSPVLDAAPWPGLLFGADLDTVVAALAPGHPEPVEHLYLIPLPDCPAVLSLVNRPEGYRRFAAERLDGYVREIAAVVVQIRALREKERLRGLVRLQGQALELTANAVFITDREGVIQWVNPAFERISGYSSAEAVGRTPRLLKSGQCLPGCYEELWATILSGQTYQRELINRHKDGGLFNINLSIQPLTDDAGAISHFVAIEEDITARKQAEARSSYLARFDALTGLPNRQQFMERLDLALHETRRDPGRNTALILVGVDHMRVFNDRHGHDVGDALLKQVAVRLEESIRPSDVAARLSGDEFAVLLQVRGSSGQSEQLVERLRRALSSPLTLDVDGEPIETRLSVTMGVTIFPIDAVDTPALLQHADLALNLAKRESRGMVHFYLPGQQERFLRRSQLLDALYHAIERGELSLHWQPQVRLSDGVVLGAEALMRWRHPDFGAVPPSEFIPLAEESGLIKLLGSWALEQAVDSARRLGHELRVAVNVSFGQFGQQPLAQQIDELLGQSGVPAHRLELELTESVLARDLDHMVELLAELKALQVQLAIDDFGTGFSSLAYLDRLGADRIKIDRSFVMGLPELGQTEPGSAAIVQATVAMAKALGMAVIAEGVETPGQLRWLQDNHCDEIQGYLIARPMPESELPRFLEQWPQRWAELVGESGRR